MTRAAVDLAVVGGGVLGLAHAIAGVRAGLRVVLCERNAFARGASVRNFGMIWPIGQPAGALQRQALRSRELWLDLAGLAGFRCATSGSLHVASHDDEWRVLQEFAADSTLPGLELLTPAAAVARQPRLVTTGLRGALFSPNEANVDPGAAIAALHAWCRTAGVERRFGVPVVAIEDRVVHLADGGEIIAQRVVVCSGDDLVTVYPQVLAASGLVRCRLQMLALGPPPVGFALGPMLAGGLTLLHYPSFAACPGLAAVQDRLGNERAAEIGRGIHVMVSQRDDGCLIVGDSHEYGAEFSPGLDVRTEELILGYLDTFFRPVQRGIVARWSGCYSKTTDGAPIFRATPEPGVEIVTGVGGSGMTRAFAIGEETVAAWGAS